MCALREIDVGVDVPLWIEPSDGSEMPNDACSRVGIEKENDCKDVFWQPK